MYPSEHSINSSALCPVSPGSLCTQGPEPSMYSSQHSLMLPSSPHHQGIEPARCPREHSINLLQRCPVPPSHLCPHGAEPPSRPSPEQQQGSCLPWSNCSRAAALPPALTPQHHQSLKPPLLGARGCHGLVTCLGSPSLHSPGSMAVPWIGCLCHHPGKPSATPGYPRVMHAPSLLPSPCNNLCLHRAPEPRTLSRST